MTDRVLILDFGSQVTQLIARRLRESGVYCEIHPFNMSEERLLAFAPQAVILSGGPASVTEQASPRAPEQVFALGVPVLGICYGEQTMCAQLGGRVAGSDHREFGRAVIEIIADCALFEGLWPKGSRASVWMSHGDRVELLPPGFRVVAISEGAPFAAIADDRRCFYGVQFHPEVVHTPDGAGLLKNFTHRVAGLRGDWSMAAYQYRGGCPHPPPGRRRARHLRPFRRSRQLGRGGAAARGVGRQAHLHLRRYRLVAPSRSGRSGDACSAIITTSRSSIATPARCFSPSSPASTDPEAKRKIIGATFIDVFDEEAQKIGGAEFLAQGHALSRRDRVRQLHRRPQRHDQVASQCRRPAGADEAEADRAPARAVQGRGARARPRTRPPRAADRTPSLSGSGPRHPHPRRGHARPSSTSCARPTRSIFDEIRAAGLYDAIWQAFAVLLPVRSVGVMGDGRTYDYVCALRAVTSTDGMTADSYPFAHDFLSRTATRIINEVRGINRVVYDVTSKPPGTIEWE